MTKPWPQEENAISTPQLNFSSLTRKSSSRIAPFISMFCPSSTRAQTSPVKLAESEQACVTQHGESITGLNALRNMFPIQAPRVLSHFSLQPSCQIIKTAARVASPSGLPGSSTLAMPRLEQAKRWLQKPVRTASHRPRIPLVCFLSSGWSTASLSCTPWLRIARSNEGCSLQGILRGPHLPSEDVFRSRAT